MRDNPLKAPTEMDNTSRSDASPDKSALTHIRHWLIAIYLLLLLVLAATTYKAILAAGENAHADHFMQRQMAGALLVALVFGVLFHLIERSLARQEKLSRYHRSAEQALRESEAKYRALVENIPQRVFHKDRQLRFVAANQGFAEDLGLPMAEIIGRDDFELHPPEVAEKFRQSDQHVMATGQVEAFDELFVHNGQAFTIHSVKTPVRDENGAIVGVCGIYWDITEQRKLKDQLQESEARLRAIFDNVQEGIIVAEADTLRHVMVNPAICRMLGYSEAELLALSPPGLHPPQAQARLEETFRSMVDGKHGLVRELTTLRKDGSTFYATISTSSLDMDGRPCFVGVFHDITEMLEAREALARSEARLREAQRLAHLGSWEHVLPDNRLFWSDETCRIFEIDPSGPAPTHDMFLAALHPEDRQRVLHTYQESIAQRFDYQILHRLLMADGRIKHVRERVRTEYDPDGRPLRTFGTIQDVTEQAQAEQEIRDLNETLERRVAVRTEELARANRELESFSYSVSHDLRAPLRAINGFSRILQDTAEPALSAENRQLLERIVHNTNRMGDLIDDILDYSRASQTALRHRSVDLATLAQEICAELAPTYPKAVVRIGALGHAWGDATMLRQVLSNLIGNALKYTGKRDTPEIVVGAEPGESEIVFFVRDNGAGFDMQYAGKLFGMFQRMHTDKDFPGTGVGLAITKRIIERHGGRIWAEAVKEGGATFRFVLPVQPAQT